MRLVPLLLLLLLTVSCEQVSKKFQEKNGLKGAPIYVTSREGLVKDIASKTNISEKQISISYVYGENEGKRTKDLQVNFLQIPDSLLNETTAQQISNEAYLLAKEQIANIALYNHVNVVLRNEEVNKNVTKRVEIIVNKQ